MSDVDRCPACDAVVSFPDDGPAEHAEPKCEQFLRLTDVEFRCWSARESIQRVMQGAGLWPGRVLS